MTGGDASDRRGRTRRPSRGIGRGAPLVVGVALLAWTVTGCGATPSRATGAAANPGPGGVSRLAPYVDVTLDPAPDLTAVAARGVRVFNLGFVTAPPGECRPSWGGWLPYDDAAMIARVRALRQRGGDVRVSFGGAGSEELAQTCRSVPELVDAYQKVIDTYQLTLVDVDVEGAALKDHDAVRRRDLALSELQKAARRRGGSLDVSYTLPAEADGLTAQAQELVRDADAAGVDLDVVNVMTMNLGIGSGDMAHQSMAVAAATEAFVRSVWTGRPEGAAWSMIAVTPMIGVNDSPGEVFRPGDAVRLVDFARQHKLAWLSFWSLNRDRPCPPGTPSATASPSCSGVEQDAGQFTSILAQYR